MDLPRGLRNNNPGNIRYSAANDWVGKIPFSRNTDAGKTFEQFQYLHQGIRAKMVLIYNKITQGTNTIEKLITVYAPPIENNTAAYIKQVASMVGYAANVPIELTAESLISLCKAISYVENGSSYSSFVTDQDYTEAIAIFDRPLKKKAAIARQK
jgi:hypothetical protein